METQEAPRSWWSDPLVVRIVGCVFLVTMCWIVGNPRSAGPDEPSHMVTSAAVVRGQFDGNVPADNPAIEIFDLPGMVGAPDPVCWAQQPTVTVRCADTTALGTEDEPRATTSSNYAPWTFVLPGFASLAPWADGYAYLARLLNALIPIALLSGGLIALTRTRSAAAPAALLGLTPIVWFTIGTVNPSALAIAGGFALWVGTLVPPGSLATTLALGGWASVLLARRDGPFWATAIVLACCAVVAVRPKVLWDRLGHRARWVAVAPAPVALLPVLQRSDYGLNALLAASTIALVVVDLAIRWWVRHPDRSARVAFSTIGASLAVWILVAAIALRPGGFQAETLRLVMSNTGHHLEQIVGVLGWLDAPVPVTGVLLYWAGLGALAAVAWLEVPRTAIVFCVALLAAVVAAWLLELGQGANYGQYWQGRYTMPFAVGFPIVLAWRPATALVERLGGPIAAVAWIVANLGFASAQRRWGVGIDGSWYPWDWDTWGAPVPPVLLVIAHAIITAALARTVLADRRTTAESAT